MMRGRQTWFYSVNADEVLMVTRLTEDREDDGSREQQPVETMVMISTTSAMTALPQSRLVKHRSSVSGTEAHILRTLILVWSAKGCWPSCRIWRVWSENVSLMEERGDSSLQERALLMAQWRTCKYRQCKRHYRRNVIPLINHVCMSVQIDAWALCALSLPLLLYHVNPYTLNISSGSILVGAPQVNRSTYGKK